MKKVSLKVTPFILSLFGLMFFVEPTNRINDAFISANIEALTRNYDNIPAANGCTYRAVQMGIKATEEEISKYSNWLAGCYLTMRPVATISGEDRVFMTTDGETETLSKCADTDGVWPYTIQGTSYCWARFSSHGNIMAD